MRVKKNRTKQAYAGGVLLQSPGLHSHPLVGVLVVLYTPHTLVAFGGKLNVGAPDSEIWQCGVRVEASVAGQLVDPGGYMQQIKDPLAAWFSTAGSNGGFNVNAQLKYLKVNNIGANGKYSDPSTNVFDYPGAGIVGGQNQAPKPDIMCLCLSWATDVAVRKGAYATHGRIYPPNYDLEVVTPAGMRVTPATTAAWTAKAIDLLTLLNAGPILAFPVIASPHAGEIRRISGVRVGDVMDVQRRRKSALAETYASATF